MFRLRLPCFLITLSAAVCYNIRAESSSAQKTEVNLNISPPASMDKSNPEFHLLAEQRSRALKGVVDASHLLPYTARTSEELDEEFAEKMRSLKGDFQRALRLSRQPPQNLNIAFKSGQQVLREEMLLHKKSLKKNK